MLEFIQNNPVEILTVIIAIVGIVAGTVSQRLKPIFEQAEEGLKLYRQFKTKDSEGGKQITKREQAELLEAMGEIFMEIINIIKVRGFLGTIKKWITKLFG